MRIESFFRKVVVVFLVASVSICANAYRTTGPGTLPHVWTRNYSGVLAAAKQTGYPILMVVVNSATCGHCHVLNQLTLNSSTFAKMESDLTFYKLMMDAPNGGEFNTVVNRYYSYFNFGMYPIIGVLRSDGNMYGSFGNRVTDTRDVSLDIRQLIENLAKEQNADIWSGSGVEPFSTVSEIEPAKPTAQEWAAKLKGKLNGVAFDSNQEMVASFSMNLNARGKATARFTSYSGRANARGELSLDGEIPQIKGDSLLLKYDAAAKTWSGRWGDYTAYASTLPSKGQNGVYTAAATNVTASGFVNVTVKNGKGKVAGVVGGKNRISANGVAVLLPSAIVVAELDRWAADSDLTFVPVVKAGKFSGCAAVSTSGGMAVSFRAFGRNWTGSGATWSGNTNLSVLSGKVLRIAGMEIPVQVKGAKKIAAGDNSVSARLSATVRNGTFKGSVKLPTGTCRFEGAFLRDGKSVYGIGVSYGAGVYLVEIGDARK